MPGTSSRRALDGSATGPWLGKGRKSCWLWGRQLLGTSRGKQEELLGPQQQGPAGAEVLASATARREVPQNPFEHGARGGRAGALGDQAPQHAPRQGSRQPHQLSPVDHAPQGPFGRAAGRGRVGGRAPDEVGRGLGESVLQLLDHAREGAQVLEAGVAAELPDQGQDPVAGPSAGELRVGVAGVLAPGQAARREQRTDLLAPQGEQRADHAHGLIRCPCAPGLVGAGAAQSGELGTPYPAHQNRFEGVVGVVSGEEGPVSRALRLLGQEAVTLLARAGFQARGAAVQIGTEADEGHAQGAAEVGREARIGVALRSPESVVDVGGTNGNARMGGRQPVQEQDAVGTSRKGEEELLVRRDSRHAGEVRPALGPVVERACEGRARAGMAGRHESSGAD